MKTTFLIMYTFSRNIKQILSHPSSFKNQFQRYFSNIVSEKTEFANHELKIDSGQLSNTDHLSSVDNISTGADAVYLLKMLRMQTFKKNLTFKNLNSDDRFITLCKIFETSCHSLVPNMLVSGLRSLLEIGQPPSSQTIDNIELLIMSRLRHFTITDLIGCLHLHNKFLETGRQKAVVSLLTENICNKTSEINSVVHILMLSEVSHLFTQEDWKLIQNKIIEIIPTLETQNLIKIICTLAENTKRNPVLLNSVGYCLRQNEKKPSLKETVNLLYALKILNYLNPKLLLYLTSDRKKEIKSVEQQSIISGLLAACGQLKWRHSGLLEACGSWILEHIDCCTSRELVSYILTAAALNYKPKDSSVIRTILGHLKLENLDSKDIILDVVWSLGVLDVLDKELLIKVLSPDFYSTLLDDSSYSSLGNKLKLLNLKSLLKIQYPELVFSCNFFLDPPIVPRNLEAEKQKNNVLEAMSLFITRTKHMCVNINSDMGIFIDSEFIMDSKGKPLPLSDYGLISKPIVSNIKNLPPGAKRIALMIWLYKDYTLNEETLIGINALAVRLLSSFGLSVIQIPYKTFAKQKTLVKKVTYLSEAIKNVVSQTVDKK